MFSKPTQNPRPKPPAKSEAQARKTRVPHPYLIFVAWQRFIMRPHVDKEAYSIEILRKNLKSLRILPVPSTTQHSGSSAMHTGSPVSSRIRLSKGTASREHDAAVADVGGKLRRRALQGHADRAHNGRDGPAQCLADLAVVHADRLGLTLGEAPPFDLRGQRLVQRIRRANLDLDPLRRALPDKQVIFSLQVARDGFIHVIARDAQRV